MIGKWDWGRRGRGRGRGEDSRGGNSTIDLLRYKLCVYVLYRDEFVDDFLIFFFEFFDEFAIDSDISYLYKVRDVRGS